MKPGVDGNIEMSANLTYIDSEQQLLADGPVEQLAGRLFNPPHWRGRGMISWSNGAFTAAATLNRIGGVKDVRSTPALHIDGMTTIDISARYRFGEEGGVARRRAWPLGPEYSQCLAFGRRDQPLL